MNLDYIRGNVWFVNLPRPDVLSSVQFGYRPVVIISSFAGSATSDVVTVVPCTSKYKDIEVNVPLNADFLDRPTYALTNQLVTVPKAALRQHMGMCSKETMENIERAVLISLGIAQATTDTVKASQEALANAKKDRQELENLLPQAKQLLEKLQNLIYRVEPSKLMKQTRKKRSPQEIADFIREYEDPLNVKKDVAAAFGFKTPQQAYQFYRRVKSKQ